MAWVHNGRKYWYHNGKRYSCRYRNRYSGMTFGQLNKKLQRQFKNGTYTRKGKTKDEIFAELKAL